MPYKNIEDRRAYHRDYRRKVRSGSKDKKSSNSAPRKPYSWKARTAEDLINILEEQLNRLLNEEIDVAVQARACANLLSVGTRIIEAGDLEARIVELEAVVRKPITPLVEI